jgi:hypothetical protein
MSKERRPPAGNHHILPNPAGGWNVRRGGGNRASGHFQTKTEAVNRGREISRNAGTELKIHNRDGRIAQSDSHGRDPRSYGRKLVTV